MPRERYNPAPERSVRRLVLRGIGVHLYRHPFLGLIALLALTVGALWHIGEVGVSASLRTAMPMSTEERRTWGAARLAAIRHDPVIAVVTLSGSAAESAPREDVVRTLRRAFDDPAWLVSIREIAPTPPEKETPNLGYDEILRRMRPADLRDLSDLSDESSAVFLFYRAWGAPGNLTDAQRAAARTDPGGVFRRLAEEHSLDPNDSAIVRIAHAPVRPGPKTIVLRLNPVRAAGELLYSMRLRDYLEKTARALTEKGVLPGDDRPPAGDEAAPAAWDLKGAEIDFTGPHVETARIAARLAEKLVWLLGVLTICLVLLMILAFRKAEAVFFVATPAALGLVWTYGAIGWLHPRVNLLTAVLPILLLGLAWEFSLQIYHRFVEELYRQRRYYPALATAYTEAGRGIFVATLATVLMFATLLLTHTSILREWATVGIAGTIAMALSALLVLPVLASLKSLLARENVFPLETYDFGLKQLSAMVIASPRSMLVLGLILTAWLTGFARQLKIDREVGLDLMAASEQSADIEAAPGSDPTLSILVEGNSLQEALEHNDRLYDNLRRIPGRLAPLRIQSLSPDLPALGTQLAIRRGIAGIDPRAFEASLLMATRRLDLPTDFFVPAVAALTGLRRATAAVPLIDLELTASDRLISLAQTRIVRTNGRCLVRTSVLPRTESTSTRSGFAEFRRLASVGLPLETLKFDSEALQNRRLAYHVIYGIALSVILSGLVLLACLLPHFHGRIGDTALALLPLACSVVWTLGALSALGRRIGLHTLLGFPLVSAIVVSQSILLIQRLYDRRYASLRQVVRQGGRPGIISGVALMLALGVLNPLPFPALEAMTTAALFAVGFGVAGVVLFLPALIEIRNQGGLAAWADDPEEALADDAGHEATGV